MIEKQMIREIKKSSPSFIFAVYFFKFQKDEWQRKNKESSSRRKAVNEFLKGMQEDPSEFQEMLLSELRISKENYIKTIKGE